MADERGLQIRQRHRFRDNAVHAGGQEDDLVFGGGIGGQCDDRDARHEAGKHTDLLRGLLPAHALHENVHEYYIVRFEPQSLQRVRAVGYGIDRMTGAAQQGRGDHAVRMHVVHQ